MRLSYNIEEWDRPDDSYLKKLKEHYLDDTVNALLANATDRKFIRRYPIISLSDLFERDEPNKLFEYKLIVKKAKELGYSGNNSGILSGLHVLWDLV